MKAVTIPVVAWAFGGAFTRISTSPTIDFFNLWSVPRAIALQQVRNIYDPDEQRSMAAALATDATRSGSLLQARVTAITAQLYGGRVDALGSPVIYALVGVLSTDNYEHDQKVFVLLLLCAFVLSMTIAGFALGWPLAAVGITIVACLGWCPPLTADLQVANINTIQLIPLVISAWAAGHGHLRTAGIAVGIGIALKPNTLGVVAVYCAILTSQRQLALLSAYVGGVLGGFVVAIAWSASYLGMTSVWWQYAARVIDTMGPSEYPLKVGNYGLAALLYHATGVRMSTGAGIVVLCLVGVWSSVCALGANNAIQLYQSRRPTPVDDAWISVGVGCIVMLVTSQLVWIHYYVLLLPFALYLMSPTGTRPSWNPRLSRAVYFMCWLFLSQLMYQTTRTAVAESVLLNVAAIAMLAFGVADLYRRRAGVGA